MQRLRTVPGKMAELFSNSISNLEDFVMSSPETPTSNTDYRAIRWPLMGRIEDTSSEVSLDLYSLANVLVGEWDSLPVSIPNDKTTSVKDKDEEVMKVQLNTNSEVLSQRDYLSDTDITDSSLDFYLLDEELVEISPKPIEQPLGLAEKQDETEEEERENRMHQNQRRYVSEGGGRMKKQERDLQFVKMRPIPSSTVGSRTPSTTTWSAKRVSSAPEPATSTRSSETRDQNRDGAPPAQPRSTGSTSISAEMSIMYIPGRIPSSAPLRQPPPPVCPPIQHLPTTRESGSASGSRREKRGLEAMYRSDAVEKIREMGERVLNESRIMRQSQERETGIGSTPAILDQKNSTDSMVEVREDRGWRSLNVPSSREQDLRPLPRKATLSSTESSPYSVQKSSRLQGPPRYVDRRETDPYARAKPSKIDKYNQQDNEMLERDFGMRLTLECIEFHYNVHDISAQNSIEDSSLSEEKNQQQKPENKLVDNQERRDVFAGKMGAPRDNDKVGNIDKYGFERVPVYGIGSGLHPKLLSKGNSNKPANIAKSDYDSTASSPTQIIENQTIESKPPPLKYENGESTSSSPRGTLIPTREGVLGLSVCSSGRPRSRPSLVNEVEQEAAEISGNGLSKQLGFSRLSLTRKDDSDSEDELAFSLPKKSTWQDSNVAESSRMTLNADC